MASTLHLILCLGMVALCLATPVNNVRWCVKSEVEMKKCRDLTRTCGCEQASLSCVLRSNTDECIKAIAEDQADAISLDSGEIYKASLIPYELIPVAAENYGTEKDPVTCYRSVALVKESSNFKINELKGKRSCHTAVGRAAGWVVPLGTLITLGYMSWEGPESTSIERAAASFFSAACAPGASSPNMCKQCGGPKEYKCKASHNERYYGYDGACLCLKEDKGDVAFVNDKLSEEYKQGGYELLCMDNTRKSVSESKICSWGRIPAHAVVTANRDEKIKAVVQFLEEAQKKPECKLFSSVHGKDLMFKSSAVGLLTLPEKMNSFLYLGQLFTNANKALYTETVPLPEDSIRWCTQSNEEKKKCDSWSIASEGKIECIEASSAEECILLVLKGDADAVSLDGGYLHTAGACGLVPAMQEIYDADMCKQKTKKKGTYKAVAVVKASNKKINWNNLKGSKSCHTGVGRTAGFNIPVGKIYNETGVCDLSTIFHSACIPGENPESKLCQLCAGNEKTKCLPNNKEPYYGYEGALRCLIEKGDIVFIKDNTVLSNIESENTPAWAKGVKKSDLELLCKDGSRMPVDEYEKCHLAEVPAHAVATNPDRKEIVSKILKEQQEKFGRNAGSDSTFQMYVSQGRKDQLFKDSTQCLSDVEDKTMNEYLGRDYSEAMENLGKCKKSGLLQACTFHTC